MTKDKSNVNKNPAAVDLGSEEVNESKEDISLCNACLCMTKTVTVCGKCGISKEAAVMPPQSVQLSSADPSIPPADEKPDEDVSKSGDASTIVPAADDELDKILQPLRKYSISIAFERELGEAKASLLTWRERECTRREIAYYKSRSGRYRIYVLELKDGCYYVGMTKLSPEQRLG